MAERRSYNLSCDRYVFMTPAQAVGLYGLYGNKEMGFGGLEAAAWLYAPAFLWLAKKQGIPVRGIHGRIGQPFDNRPLGNRIKVEIANKLMCPTKYLVRLADKFGLDYILVHTPEAYMHFDELLKFKGQIRIENDNYLNGGLDVSNGMVKALSRHGANAVLNLDTIHYAVEMNFQSSSSQVVERGTTILAEVLPGANHEAIGQVSDDSYYPGSVPTPVLEARGRFYQQHPEIGLTFESQWRESRLVALPETYRQTRNANERNMRILDRAGWFTI